MEEETVSVLDSEGKPIVGAIVTKGGEMYRKYGREESGYRIEKEPDAMLRVADLFRLGPIGFTPTMTGITDEKGEVREWRKEWRLREIKEKEERKIIIEMLKEIKQKSEHWKFHRVQLNTQESENIVLKVVPMKGLGEKG